MKSIFVRNFIVAFSIAGATSFIYSFKNAQAASRLETVSAASIANAFEGYKSPAVLTACSAAIFKARTNAATTSDTVQAQASITKFLRWYKTNYTKANSFNILAKDAAGNFIVSKTGYTNYLNYLKSSRLISPKYIGYWQTFFVDKEKELKKDKNKSDVPDGFDMDFVLITQEPDIILDKIDSIEFNINSMNNSVALIGLKLPGKDEVEYEFEMYKSLAGWQIGYISTPNYD